MHFYQNLIRQIYLDRTFKTIIFTYEIKFSTDMSSQLSHFGKERSAALI